MHSRLTVVISALALVAVLAAPLAAAPQPAGNEFLLNTDDQSQQHNPAAAFNSAGTALVVWENDQDGLRGRFVAQNGTLPGPEIGLVANVGLPAIPGQGTIINRKDPAVVSVPNSGFLLFWTEETASAEALPLFQNVQVLSRNVFMQRFDATGAAATQPVQLNQTTTGFASKPQAVRLASGAVLVAWEGDGRAATVNGADGIFGRLVSAAGAPLSAEMHLNSTPERAHNVALAADAKTGRVLVAWEGRGGAGVQVFARAFDPSVHALSGDLLVSGSAVGAQRRPSVASDGRGDFLVVWQSFFGDIYHSRVLGQPVSGAGALLGKSVQISQGFGPAQIAPTVAATPQGNFLVVWMEYDQWFPMRMGGVQVNAAGQPMSAEFEVNQRQIGAKLETSIAANGNGGFLVPYEYFFSGDNLGIGARLLTAH